MSESLHPLALAVEADHHDHHDRHLSEVGDGGDDAALLLSPTPEEMDSDDPIAVIEAALIRLKDDVGVLAEEAVVQAFSVLKYPRKPCTTPNNVPSGMSG